MNLYSSVNKQYTEILLVIYMVYQCLPIHRTVLNSEWSVMEWNVWTTNVVLYVPYKTCAS